MWSLYLCLVLHKMSTKMTLNPRAFPHTPKSFQCPKCHEGHCCIGCGRDTGGECYPSFCGGEHCEVNLQIYLGKYHRWNESYACICGFTGCTDPTCIDLDNEMRK